MSRWVWIRAVGAVLTLDGEHEVDHLVTQVMVAPEGNASLTP